MQIENANANKDTNTNKDAKVDEEKCRQKLKSE